MTNLWANSLARSRYPLAILAGVALAASFPPIGMAGLAWIAPGLMAAAALGNIGWKRFRIGYVAGLAYYLTELYWLLLIPYRWHGIPFGPAAGWLSLGAFLALFPAAWVWVVGRTPQGASGDSEERRTWSVEESLPATWLSRTGWALSGAAVWVALEMILTRIFGGFPWDLLGVSQYQMTPLIQIASFAGVYGVSFLIVWCSLSLVSAAAKIFRHSGTSRTWAGEVFLPAIVVALTFNLGFRQIHQSAAPARTLRVTAMQPSIPQTLIWDESKNDERFHELLRLCDQVLTNQTDLILWPESAVPDLLRYDTNTFEAVTGLARRHHAWMIICADDAELRPGSNSFKDADFFNSSFLISPEGRIADRYIKRNLVIFGEYIPLVRWLPFVKWFTPIQGGFTPGTRANPFEFREKDLAVSTSVLICFEDIFPQLGREGTRTNTDFLVNLTNDGWFDESAAQWQQAATGLFRAVENHVPLIRCTNNGLTCWVDACGRMREVFRDERNSVYGAGFMTFEIPVLAGATRPRTFYNEHGDWFGWACVGLAVLMVARKRKQLMSIGAQNSNPARQ